MRPPRRPHAAGRLAALAVAALAGCAQPAGEKCPGRIFAALELEGVRDDAGTGCAVPPEGGWAVPEVLEPFEADLRFDEATGTLAYCAGGPHAAVLRGRRDGDHVRAEVTVPGAVLGPCARTCLPLQTVTVEGDLAGPEGGPFTFTGALTETFDGGTGPCGACQLPCTTRYLVTGASR